MSTAGSPDTTVTIRYIGDGESATAQGLVQRLANDLAGRGFTTHADVSGEAGEPSGAQILISHTAEDGLVVTSPNRETDTPVRKKILRDHGLRWTGRSQLWFLRDSRDRRPNEPKLRLLAAELAATGADVDVEIGDWMRSREQIEADRRENVEARAEALDAKADRRDQEADRRLEAADTIADLIPMGQPILEGHHSAPRHRRDLARINANREKGYAAADEAKEARRRAGAAQANLAHREDGGTVERRTLKSQKELDKLQRSLREFGYRIEDGELVDFRMAEGKIESRSDQIAAWAEERLEDVQRLEDDIDYWNGFLGELVRNGDYRVLTADDFKGCVGTLASRVCQRGHWGIVLKVNAKTLRMSSDVMSEVSGNIDYDQIDFWVEGDEVIGRDGREHPEHEGVALRGEGLSPMLRERVRKLSPAPAKPQVELAAVSETEKEPDAPIADRETFGDPLEGGLF